MELGQQIGPMPLGAWVVVVGAGVGIAWYSSRNANPQTVPVVDTSGGVGTGAVGGGQWVDLNPPAAAPPVNTKPTTNEEWGIQAVNFLIAQGYDPVMADQTIRKYLATEKLGAQEYTLLLLALAKFGSPPQILPPGPDLQKPPTSAPPPIVAPPTPPAPAPAPSPRNFTTAVVTPWPTKHSTLFGIASDKYGNGNRWPELFEANRYGKTRLDGTPGMIRDPNLLQPGWVLVLPGLP